MRTSCTGLGAARAETHSNDIRPSIEFSFLEDLSEIEMANITRKESLRLVAIPGAD